MLLQMNAPVISSILLPSEIFPLLDLHSSFPVHDPNM